ncbi:probable G-protein coupled receptor 34 [Mugil cephalus]|uniref:probable G-protein coupled receptor 34 n=1 Tax=Mugil cephalus TaxID=48193 RepID=UPI001FB7BE28|nr:probable G-protein coupled receptor 34 [Mugil cephalus]XP_047457829.1 probable G-protein coupled receptor 34 [Mugil cephalus]
MTKMNLTNNSSEHCVDFLALQTPLAVFYSIIFVLGLTGNLVALWVFFCVNSKKNSVRVFLINVAFADLLLVVCLPFRIIYHSQGNTWNLNHRLCIVVGGIFYMNMYISITLLGLISVDRYLKIHCNARVRHRLSRKWSTVLCTAVWTGAFAMIFMFLISGDEDNNERCFHYKTLHHAKWKSYINMTSVAIFWLVFISLAMSYGKIALKLLKTSQERPDLPNAQCYTRTAKKSFFILFVFIFCFVPYHSTRVFYIITQITDISCFWRDVADKANEVTLLLSAFNSCLDPVMFFVLSSSVRKEVQRLVSSVFCVRDVARVSGSSSSVEVDSRGRTELISNMNVSSNLRATLTPA